MQLKRTQTGAAMVEFAIVLPLFLVLTFGIIEYSLMFYDKALITNASREAARSAIALRSPALTSAGLTNQTNTVLCNYLGKNATACPNGNNLLISLGGTNSAATAALSYNPNLTGAAKLPSGTLITVTVSYTYNTLVIGALINVMTANSNALSQVPISASTTMISE